MSNKNNNNKNQETLEKLNLLVEKSYISQIPLERGFVSYRSTSNSCLIHEESLNEALESILKVDSNLGKTLSKEEIMTNLKYLVLGCLVDMSTLTLELVTTFLNRLKSSYPLREWEVFRPLHGAKLTTNSSFELGIYKIYKSSEFNQILSKLDDSDSISAMSFGEGDYLVISTKVKASDQEKAKEIADVEFHKFDNIMSYILPSNSFNVAVFDYSAAFLSKILFISNHEAQSAKFEIEGVIDFAILDGRMPFLISNIGDTELQENFPEPFFFKSTSLGYEWLWDTFKKSNPSDLETRLMTAIEWIGKSKRDTVKPRAFVQLVFAIESIFQYEEDKFVNPSITSRISDAVAFVLGKSVGERIDINKQMKAIYGKRSGTVHGGDSSISEEFLKQTLSLVERLIREMTTNPTFLEMSKSKDFVDWVTEKKYA